MFKFEPMNVINKFIAGWNSVLYEQTTDGTHFYTLDEHDFSSKKKVMFYAQQHPILTTGIDFVSQIFSRAEFWVEREDGSKVKNHWILDLINNPGYTLTRNDFLKSIYANSTALGTVVIEKIHPVGMTRPSKLNIIDLLKCKFPDIKASDYRIGNYDKYKIIYDETGENREIEIKDIIFIRDMATSPSNVKFSNDSYGSRFIFTSNSRLDGLLQTLYNTVVSLEAKEVILKTNGKELFSSKSANGDFPLSSKHKTEIENDVNTNYGLMKGRSRAIVTNAAVEWKSLHVAIRDLGLNESVKVDADLIFGALQIPRDIMSLDLKKASYQNQKESMLSYLQNVLQTKVDDFCETLDVEIEDGLTLKGGYDHLSIMKSILDQKYKGVLERGKALKQLRDAGIPWEEALEMVDMDVNIKEDEKSAERGSKIKPESGQTGQASQEANDEDSGKEIVRMLHKKMM